MQIFLVTFCALGLVGVVALIRASFTAPEGFEDAGGFHHLNRKDAERFEYSPRLSLSEGDVVFFR